MTNSLLQRNICAPISLLASEKKDNLICDLMEKVFFESLESAGYWKLCISEHSAQYFIKAFVETGQVEVKRSGLITDLYLYGCVLIQDLKLASREASVPTVDPFSVHYVKISGWQQVWWSDDSFIIWTGNRKKGRDIWRSLDNFSWPLLKKSFSSFPFSIWQNNECSSGLKL